MSFDSILKKSLDEDNAIEYIYEFLPLHMVDAIKRFEKKLVTGKIEEIRIRKNKYISITSSTVNYRLNIVCTPTEIAEIVVKLCDDSVYAHSDTIKNGYISLRNGIRVGLCGKAAIENGTILGISDITSLCIRIPHEAPDVGIEICSLLKQMKMQKGILIYSIPGEGKTTILRSVCNKLSGGSKPYRVSVIDTRGELAYSLEKKELCIDILSGYSKAIGIEIAARTLSAQLIVCDEIGNYDEAEAIIYAHNCGIPLLASAHASDFNELMNKPAIYYMFKAGIFGAFVGIKRKNGLFDYNYDIKRSEDIYEPNSCI